MTKKIKVLSIFGTRPEAVKMSPVVKVLQAEPSIESVVCVTAQHREMLDQVLTAFEVTPDIDLNLMQPNQSLAQITAAILTNLEPILRDVQPDWVLVQGDTTTVMTTALLCHYHQIHIGHVEAGLRTGNKWQPFPEEINRKIAGVVADLHLAPTEHSRQNLLNEGVADKSIVVTGNPAIDALRIISQKPAPPQAADLIRQHRIGHNGTRLILVTAHRRENFGQPLENIIQALQQLAQHYGEKIHLIYPVHLNPNVQTPVYDQLGKIDNITLLPPMDYLPMVHLMKHAALVLTDSGGIQEEATGLGKPTLVMRATTERPEGVQAGVLKLVGTESADIVREAQLLLDNPSAYQKMAQAANPFGDGYAAEKIVQAILNFQR